MKVKVALMMGEEVEEEEVVGVGVPWGEGEELHLLLGLLGRSKTCNDFINN